MNGYTIKPSIEPNDKYEKARQDVFQALNSISDLDMQQQQRLLLELVGIEKFNMLIKFYQQFICQK
ncbi:MAG: hypothetical protein K2K89_00915 [Ruminococcus sp.]|nr:hypothetical protein [Ruminococcus sp.]